PARRSDPRCALEQLVRPAPAGLPPGFSGGVLGAVGALPVLALARALAFRFGRPPALPGAESAVGDVKLASYAEIAVAIIVIPGAAWFFGSFMPEVMERR